MCSAGRLCRPRPAPDGPRRPLPVWRPLPLRPEDAEPRRAGRRPAARRGLDSVGRTARIRVYLCGCVYVETSANAYRVAPSPDAGAACPPPLPASPGPTADSRPPGLTLRAPRRERLRRVLTVAATCDESCALSATGWLRTSKARTSAVCTARSHRPGCPGELKFLGPGSGAPGTPIKLRLKMSKRNPPCTQRPPSGTGRQRGR